MTFEGLYAVFSFPDFSRQCGYRMSRYTLRFTFVIVELFNKILQLVLRLIVHILFSTSLFESYVI